MAAVNLKSYPFTQGSFNIRRASLSVVTPAVTAGPIKASHFNVVAGQTLMAATSVQDAAVKVGHLWGTGYGDRGYGMTSPVLVTKEAGQPVTSADWIALRTTIANLITWQDSTFAVVPALNLFDAGDSIIASEPNQLSQAADIMDNRRLSYLLANMTLTSNAVTTSRMGPWGTFPISCILSFELPSEDQMRYFFNSGGDVRISFNHPSTVTGQNARWAGVLNTLLLVFTANRTVQIDGGQYYGLDKEIGYYQLTESWQTIYDGMNMSAYVTGSNDVLIEARSTFIAGFRGAKGRVIEFKVSLNNDDPAAVDDLLVSGTSISLSHLRATTTIVIPTPTCTVVEPI